MHLSFILSITNVLLNASVIIMILGVLVFIYYLFFSKLFFSRKEKVSPDKASSFGGFMSGLTGPLFTLAGFLIIYATIIEQRQINQIQNFESSYFQFVNFHRDNINEMSMRHPKKGAIVTGHQAFVNYHFMYKIIYGVLDSSKTFSKYSTEKKKDLSFAVLYYGTTDKDSIRISKHLEKYTKSKTENEDLFRILRAVPHGEEVPSHFIGYSNVLSSYLNQFFDYVRFVDENTFLSEKEKNKYVHMLTAQNGIFEINLLYYYTNSTIAEPYQIELFHKYALDKKLDKNLLK
jgi:NADH:ubiquinone oxidoreductase subunit 5 (subunit L)/multisubunit Na+/H+ antiporter MnhA subunit